jgi:O-antigen ligase
MVSSDTKNADTVAFRNEGLKAAWEVAMRRPLFGHGLGTSLEANANFGMNDQRAHNLYLEIIEDLGLLGLPIFLGLMVALARELRTVRARHRETGTTGFPLRTADALQVFLMMNVTFSLASYGISGYEWYLMVGVCDVLTRLSVEAAPQNQAQMVATVQPEPWPKRRLIGISTRRPPVERPHPAPLRTNRDRA